MTSQSKHRSLLIKTVVAGLGLVWFGRRLLRQQRQIALAGRTVLITGGSRGLGLALVREFVSRNARVAICARDEVEMSTARADILARGGTLHTFVCDVRDPLQITRMIGQVESALGPIDLLVNNAGVITVGPLETMGIEDFQLSMETNFWAAVHTSLAVIPQMRARQFGRIVNIGSVGGKMPVPHLATYCASKFALSGFSGAMRVELAKDGILVTTVSPGLMKTGSPRNASIKGNHQAEYGWFSVGDNLPGFSMQAQNAARQIVSAAVNGDAELVLGLPAKLAAASYGLSPNLHQEITALAARAFPHSVDATSPIKPGYQSESWLTALVLNLLGRQPERNFNQLKSRD